MYLCSTQDIQLSTYATFVARLARNPQRQNAKMQYYSIVLHANCWSPKSPKCQNAVLFHCIANCWSPKSISGTQWRRCHLVSCSKRLRNNTVAVRVLLQPTVKIVMRPLALVFLASQRQQQTKAPTTSIYCGAWSFSRNELLHQCPRRNIVGPK